jgi:hypothetical protein
MIIWDVFALTVKTKTKHIKTAGTSQKRFDPKFLLLYGLEISNHTTKVP